MKSEQELGDIVHDGTPPSLSNPPETATPETDEATQGIGHVFATAKLCKKLERERNRLRERVAALERAQVPTDETCVICDGSGWRLVRHKPFTEPRSLTNTKCCDCNGTGRRPLRKPTPVAPAADAAPVPKSPVTMWYPLFQHMSEEHGLSLLDSEMDEIAIKVDESRAAGNANAALEAEMVAATAPVPATAPALTPEQVFILNHAVQEHAIRDIGNGLYTLTAAGLMDKDTMGWHRITEAGRRALREQVS